MKTVNDFISEKLKITTSTKIRNNYDKVFEKCSDLFNEVQNEESEEGEYHTFNIKGHKKYNKGFISFNESGEYFSITCYNDAMDFCDSLGLDGDFFEDYEKLDIGETINTNAGDGQEQVIRIW